MKCHVIDFVPTILELAGLDPDDIPVPDEAPTMLGVSCAPTFQGEEKQEHTCVYFHHSGNRALRKDDT